MAEACQCLNEDFISLDIFNKFCQASYPILRKVLTDLTIMRTRNQPQSDKMDYYLKLLTQYNLLPDTNTLEEAKSDKKSEEYRRLGNKYFLSQDPLQHVEAIKEYNKSICFAVSTENKSIAISNRSAILFKMELFPECIESIRLAREVGLPENLKDKLERREEMCKEKMRIDPPEEDIFPVVDLPVNQMIPYIAKCLALRENKKFGRHIIAEEEIPAGTVIALDKSYCQVLLNSHKYIRCTMCLVQVPHLLIPCDNCTQAMFCSVACKEKAMKEFHGIECSISGLILKMFRHEHLLAFRMVVCGFLAYPDTPTMQKAVKKMEREKKTLFNFNCSQELSPEEKYTPIHSLVTNEKNHDENYNQSMYVMSCLMFNILKKLSPIFRQRYLTTRKDEDFLKTIIFHHNMIGFHNSNALSSMNAVRSRTNNGTSCYGIRISSFTSLLNHSCCSNTRLFPVGTSYGLVTIKKIAAGEQVFNTQGYFYTTMPMKMRQNETQEEFGFQCKCLACTRNYPMYHELPCPDDVPPFKADRVHAFSPSAQKEKFKKIVDYIRKYGHYYPTKQLVDAEAQLVGSFRSMHKDYSLYYLALMREGEKASLTNQHNHVTPIIVGKP